MKCLFMRYVNSSTGNTLTKIASIGYGEQVTNQSIVDKALNEQIKYEKIQIGVRLQTFRV